MLSAAILVVIWSNTDLLVSVDPPFVCNTQNYLALSPSDYGDTLSLLRAGKYWDAIKFPSVTIKARVKTFSLTRRKKLKLLLSLISEL